MGVEAITSTKIPKEGSNHPSLVWRDHEHTETLPHSASSTPVSVDIGVRRARDLEMNDMINSRYVKTACSNISRQEHRVRRICESKISNFEVGIYNQRRWHLPIEILQALPLLQLGM